MKIQFKIHYNTRPGQRLAICGSSDQFGKWEVQKAQEMNYNENGFWSLSIDYRGQKALSYKYILLDIYSEDIWEAGAKRTIDIKSLKKSSIINYDQWSWPSKEEQVLSSEAFSRVIMNPGNALKGKISKAKRSFRFRIRVPRVSQGYQLCVTGNQKVLGNWSAESPILMEHKGNSLWEASVDYSRLKFPFYYKYAIYDHNNKQIESYEDGQNREFFMSDVLDTASEVIKTDEHYNFPNGSWKGAGVSVPVFSLKSKNSFGVGEFSDLVPFIDWAESIGMRMVQILPVNDTIACHNWLDSYPYKSISVVALHPLFMNLAAMGKPGDKEIRKKYDLLQKELNSEEFVAYEEVMKWKSKYFKIIFDEVKDDFFNSNSYKSFFKENKEWLIPYAAYSYLRDKYNTPDFRQWGPYKNYDQKKIDQLSKRSSKSWDDIAIHYFIQYHLDKQLMKASEHARNKHIVLKGDIPIGISPNSVEAWTEPHLFNLNGQAGAPPDDFAIKGQNWGFPTYNWDRMKKDDYEWWTKRLQKMATYFDAYRIDHILGFFRIWEIPKNAIEGILGYFNPALPISADEINSYGVNFDYDRMVNPYINYRLVYDLFKEHSEEVINTFLEEKSFERFQLKEAYNTQQKVNAYFLNGSEEEDLDGKSRMIRTGLFDLISNVIFIQLGEDSWHPRVAIHSTSSYKDLAPHQKEGLNHLYNEFYYKRHNDFWYEKGMNKLPWIVEASNMLVCGEDLGMVPDCVPPVMDDLNILSLEIQRMPKDPKKQFAHPADAPYLSVCTTSTHDMATVRGWWEKDRESIQDFYNKELGNIGEAPYYGEPWICQQILTQHLYSNAMWTIFPVQDLLAIDGLLRWEATHKEQINDPSNVRNKWRYRMHLKIEKLQKAKDFNHLLHSLISEAGRNTDY